MDEAAWHDPRVEITCVTVDCADPRRLAEFWSEALGWEMAHVAEDGAYCRPPEGGAGLEFIRVNELKTVKNRVHLGTRTDDVDAEVERLILIGATLAWEEEFPPTWPYRNVVLRDPEGNEFCLGNEPPRT
jgi:predicted enzyme related to lactoylglutathione lyase